MLSPQALERSTRAYRRGYHDGYRAGPEADPPLPPDNASFRERDYADGFMAGQNDRKWDETRHQGG